MQKIIVESATYTKEMILRGTCPFDIKGLEPKGQMLVDSDGLSFLYILEGEQYVYVSIPHTFWPVCKQMLVDEGKAFLRVGETEIELVNLYEELSYLISNIEGNANYGEEMVSKVEDIFLS